mmetsp:Transcript_6893/g.15235  ORF Transcript_6893/g.15235 Transcript_6893/m.15235 type:complete len:264 (+) Transcript_6893:88-879(+)
MVTMLLPYLVVVVAILSTAAPSDAFVVTSLPHTGIQAAAVSVRDLLHRRGGDETNDDDDSEDFIAPSSSSRRKLLSYTLPSALLMLLGDVPFASATCLTGDDSADCIGVYKESIPPIENLGEVSTITQSYGAFRPGVPPIVLSTPQSINEAVGVLNDQLIAIDEVHALISKGDFEGAGILVLRILPKIVLSGRYAVSMKQQVVPQIRQMSEEANELALVMDNHIGKALRGSLGSTTTMAQITLLSDAKAMKTSLTNFVERVAA